MPPQQSQHTSQKSPQGGEHRLDVQSLDVLRKQPREKTPRGQAISRKPHHKQPLPPQRQPLNSLSTVSSPHRARTPKFPVACGLRMYRPQEPAHQPTTLGWVDANKCLVEA